METTNEATTEPQDVASLPEWAQTLIGGLRTESADWRKKLRAAEVERDEQTARATDLATQVEHGATTLAEREAALASEQFGRLKERLIRERGLPPEVFDAVNGADEESLIKSLDVLATATSGTAAPEVEAPPAHRPNLALAADEGTDPAAQREAAARQFFGA